jgi:AcrR family transcriptional regulator
VFPTVSSVTPDPPRELPRGPHQLARDVVLASQRGRLLEAMAEAVAAKGYAAVTVADVIGRAGVSRKTFYEQFRDKEDCFLAAYDAGVELLLDTVRSADAGSGDLLTAARARTRAYLETLASEPAFAQTFLIVVAAAGPAALARREAVHDRFAAVLREQVEAAHREIPGLPAVPDEVYLAAVGATDLVVSRLVARGRIAELPALEDAVLHIQLSLLVGAGAAAAAAATRR